MLVIESNMACSAGVGLAATLARPFVSIAGYDLVRDRPQFGLGRRLRLIGRLACSQQWLDQLILPTALPSRLLGCGPKTDNALSGV